MKTKAIGEIRAPHLVGMFGPGSIVNLEKLSVMPQGTSQWNDRVASIESPSFRQQIGARRLIDTAKLAESGIGASLFPNQFVCRKCGTIQGRSTLKDFEIRHGLRCGHDGGALYPSRWIVYCERGHIDDFPYGFFAHGDSKCRGRLKLMTGSTLATTWVECECGARKSMVDAYGPKNAATRCRGRSPWLGTEPVGCEAKAKVSMKSASDVYFGAVRSAISIEPESDPFVAAVFEKLGDAVAACRSSKPSARGFLKSFERFSTTDELELDRAIDDFFNARDNPISYRDRLRAEFDALSRDCGSPHEDLYVRSIDSVGLRRRGFDGLFAVRKLKEVRVLVGFRRGGMPPDPAFDDADEDDELSKVGPEGVFPAYENRGEGIFMRLDPSGLSSWLERPAVRKRVDFFRNAEMRYKDSSGITSRGRSRGIYVLAHTFAHLMIRQLSLICGYSQSSLRERIYASEDCARPWAGFLIYTASSDADGSLGGLVATAMDGRIESALDDALDALRICSSDPVCALRVPQGFRKMSAAACHGCVVLPETSCERNNHFLDRTLAVPGTVTDESVELCFSNAL